MKRVAFAVVLLLVAAGNVSAEALGRPVRPLANVEAPPEAVTAVASGPAVVVVENLKTTVTGFAGGGPGIVLVDQLRSTVTGYTPGGPCGGPASNYGSDSQPGRPAGEVNYTPWIAGGIAGVAVFALVGWWLLRRGA